MFSVLPAFATSVWLVVHIDATRQVNTGVFKTQQRLQSSFPKLVHEWRESLRQLPSPTPFPSFFARSLDTMKKQTSHLRLHSHSSGALLRFVVLLVTPSNLNLCLLCRKNRTPSRASRHARKGRQCQCSPYENERVGLLMPEARMNSLQIFSGPKKAGQGRKLIRFLLRREGRAFM